MAIKKKERKKEIQTLILLNSVGGVGSEVAWWRGSDFRVGQRNGVGQTSSTAPLCRA